MTTHRTSPGIALGDDIRGAQSYTDALRQSGLDYVVQSVPMENFTVASEDGVLTSTLPGRQLLYHSGTGQGFAVVGSIYEVVQNVDAFAVAEHLHVAGAEFESAGEIKPGRAYMTMLLPDATVPVTELDSVTFRVILGADHTGNAGVTASIAAERLVCTNGMTVTIPGSRTSVSIRHTASAESRLAASRAVIKEAFQYARAFQAKAADLIVQPMNGAQFGTWVAREVFPAPRPEESKARWTRWENRHEELLRLFRAAETQEEGRGTRWAAFNAVSEYLSWSQPIRGGEQQRASRQLMDNGRSVRDTALESLAAV